MRRTASTLLLLLAVAGCANTPAPASPPAATAAPATTQAPPRIPTQQELADDTYYSWIVAKNLKPASSDREQELRRGHAVCDLLDEGRTRADLVTAMPLGYTDSVSNQVIAAAVKAFCPEHTGRITT